MSDDVDGKYTPKEVRYLLTNLELVVKEHHGRWEGSWSALHRKAQGKVHNAYLGNWPYCREYKSTAKFKELVKNHIVGYPYLQLIESAKGLITLLSLSGKEE